MSVRRKTFVNWQDYETEKSTDWVSSEALDLERSFRRFLDTHLVDEIESLGPNYWDPSFMVKMSEMLRIHATGAVYLMEPVCTSQEVVDMWGHVLSGHSPSKVSPVSLPNGEEFDWNPALTHPDLSIETVRDIYRATLAPPFEFDA